MGILFGRYLLGVIVALCMVFAFSSLVQADAIDGHWCFSDGRSLSIDGSDIMTPGGRSIKGEYDRHAFAYKAPQGERDAGATISMVLVSDDVLNLFRNRAQSDAKPEVWKRCKQQMS